MLSKQRRISSLSPHNREKRSSDYSNVTHWDDSLGELCMIADCKMVKCMQATFQIPGYILLFSAKEKKNLLFFPQEIRTLGTVFWSYSFEIASVWPLIAWGQHQQSPKPSPYFLKPWFILLVWIFCEGFTWAPRIFKSVWLCPPSQSCAKTES